MTENEISLDRGELGEWIRGRVAFYLDRPVDAIDPGVELAQYGLDSVYAISVISDIEDRIDEELNIAEVRQRPTIDALVDYLLTVTRRERTGTDAI